MSELKNCPFCGGETIQYGADKCCDIECNGCGILIENMTVSEYNTRTVPEGLVMIPVEARKQCNHDAGICYHPESPEKCYQEANQRNEAMIKAAQEG